MYRSWFAGQDSTTRYGESEELLLGQIGRGPTAAGHSALEARGIDDGLTDQARPRKSVRLQSPLDY
jgi:hypothetical protein